MHICYNLGKLQYCMWYGESNFGNLQESRSFLPVMKSKTSRIIPGTYLCTTQKKSQIFYQTWMITSVSGKAQQREVEKEWELTNGRMKIFRKSNWQTK